MDSAQLTQFMETIWDEKIIPALTEFIKIPNESVLFDPAWKAHGHMHRALELVTGWITAQQIAGLSMQVLEDDERTPLLLVEVPGSIQQSILLYGHIDKQPPMTGWREGLGPWQPVLDDEGRLYGRGGGDDGYAVFAAIATVKALQQAGQPHGRIVILIECSEESGSCDLPHYINTYEAQIGAPDLIICLDSGAGNYEQLWSTTSLRGMMTLTLKVEVLTEGIHSGISGGIVPNPFQIMRHLMGRLEDAATGKLLPKELFVEIPPARLEQTRQAARVVGVGIVGDLPFAGGVQPLADDYQELLLNSTWRPALAVTGQDGMPSVEKAGNVLLPQLTWKLSLRLPPTLDTTQAEQALRRVLTDAPPFGARVRLEASSAPGWDAPPLAPWLEQAASAGSKEFFGKDACYMGLGGSIPFMNMLGERFPEAQFLITGVLGPHSNAHGPNEFLHTAFAKKLNACLVRVVTAHHQHCTGR